VHPAGPDPWAAQALSFHPLGETPLKAFDCGTMNCRTRLRQSLRPHGAMPFFSLPLYAIRIGNNPRPISGTCCRFGVGTDVSRLRLRSPNKVRAESSFDRIRALRNAPYPEDTIRTIRSVVAHELALMLIRAS